MDNGIWNDKEIKKLTLSDRVTPTGKKLGSGAYGVVIEVKINKEVAAAKILHDILIEEGSKAVEQYKRECLNMSKMDHPNITKFLGLCRLKESKLPVLVTELMIDGSLHDFLEKKGDE